MRTYRLDLDTHLKKHSISQRELARRLQMSNGNLSMMKHRDTVSMTVVAKLMDIFELDSMEQLFREMEVK